MKPRIFPAITTAVLLITAATGVASAQSFMTSPLQGTDLRKPTSLQFGPDDRLYVSQQNGRIYAYTIVRDGPNSYTATEVESMAEFCEKLVRVLVSGDPGSEAEPV